MALAGDSFHGLQAARETGVRFVLVRSGPAPVDHLVSTADPVVDSIDDLPGVSSPPARTEGPALAWGHFGKPISEGALANAAGIGN